MSNSEPATHTQQSSVDPIPPGTYVADPARTGLSFRAKAFGLIWVNGQIPAVGGTFRVTDGRISGSGELAAARINTGLRARDWHLRTGHYLRTARHPNIHVSVQDAPTSPGQGNVHLVVRGNPADVTLELDSVKADDGILTLKAHGTIDRTPFGMLPPLCGVSRLVHVVATVVATRTNGEQLDDR